MPNQSILLTMTLGTQLLVSFTWKKVGIKAAENNQKTTSVCEDYCDNCCIFLIY